MFYNSGSVMEEDTDSGFNFHSSNAGDAGDSHQLNRISQADALDSPRKTVRLITDANGNTVEISASQRKYTRADKGGNAHEGEQHEVFCGRIPRDVMEQELVDLFSQHGAVAVTDLRLMMNPATNKSRGFAFVKFETREDANQAVCLVNGTEIRPGRCLGVSACKPKLRLFVGNIPKLKGRDELFVEFDKRTYGLKDVIIYNNPDDAKKNRGFCFLEYGTHRDASVAKKRLSVPPTKIWGCDILVDWADPVEEPDDDVMRKVKVLYVRNITSVVTENELRLAFGEYGIIDRVKKIKDYAFIHFHDRKEAARAKAELDKKEFGGIAIEVTWAKPPTDKQKRQDILRAREKRMLQLFSQRPLKATENTAVTQMHLEMSNLDINMQHIPPSQDMRSGQAQGSGDNEYQHFEDYEEQDAYAKFDFHHQMAAGFQPIGQPDYLPERFAGYPTFFPRGRGGGVGYGWSPSPAPRRQTLANALRQSQREEDASAEGSIYSAYSASQSGISTVREEEEPIPGFPVFQPRQTVSQSGTSTAETQHAQRRPQRQKLRGERERQHRRGAPGNLGSTQPMPVDPIDADENWRANCGQTPPSPRNRQWTPSYRKNSQSSGEREPIMAVSETGTNATTSKTTPISLSPQVSAPNVSWRDNPSS